MQNIDLLGLCEYIEKFGYTLAQNSQQDWFVLEEPRFRLAVHQFGTEHENFFATTIIKTKQGLEDPTTLDDWLDELEMLAFYKRSMIPILIGE